VTPRRRRALAVPEGQAAPDAPELRVEAVDLAGLVAASADRAAAGGCAFR
jgi:hypothetical protein